MSREQNYYGIEKLSLTTKQLRWNSGKRYRDMDRSTDSITLQEWKGRIPTSKSFYTSGYTQGSAVEVLKPFPESIYETVINGTTFDIPNTLEQRRP